jgi:beta-galactosidase beta subunit
MLQNITSSNIEWLAFPQGRNINTWNADGDGIVCVVSNPHRNVLFDQGDFVAVLPKDIHEALDHATKWLANEYPAVYADLSGE